MKEIHKFVLAGVLCGASCLFTYAQELYKNENAPVHERVADLLSRLTVEEKTVCCVLLRLVFLVWALINIIMEMRRSMELSIRGALPFFRKLLDWRRLGIRCCSKSGYCHF